VIYLILIFWQVDKPIYTAAQKSAANQIMMIEHRKEIEEFLMEEREKAYKNENLDDKFVKMMRARMSVKVMSQLTRVTNNQTLCILG
jgi:hypothetical protein